MFSEELAKISWQGTTERIASKTDADVRIALSKERLTVDDFMALISPAAVPYLEQMARKSQYYTQERFGKIISMYIPLYLSNQCSNHCVYCGFNYNNQFERTTLTEEQIKTECEAIRKLGPSADSNRRMAIDSRRRLFGTSPSDSPSLLQQPHHRGNANAAKGLLPANKIGAQRCGLFPRNLQQGTLQHLSPKRDEIDF